MSPAPATGMTVVGFAAAEPSGLPPGIRADWERYRSTGDERAWMSVLLAPWFARAAALGQPMRWPHAVTTVSRATMARLWGSLGGTIAVSERPSARRFVAAGSSAVALAELAAPIVAGALLQLPRPARTVVASRLPGPARRAARAAFPHHAVGGLPRTIVQRVAEVSGRVETVPWTLAVIGEVVGEWWLDELDWLARSHGVLPPEPGGRRFALAASWWAAVEGFCAAPPMRGGGGQPNEEVR